MVNYYTLRIIARIIPPVLLYEHVPLGNVGAASCHLRAYRSGLVLANVLR